MNDFMEEKKERILCEFSGKRCYNEREAGNILNSLKHHRRNDHLGRNKDLPRRKYFCHFCGSYHLTKQPLYDKESMHHAWEKRFYIEYEKYEKINNKLSQRA